LYTVNWGAIMSGAALSILPILIVFIFAAKNIIGAFIAGTGLKG